MIHLSCIVINIHPGICCDGSCGRLCDGMCNMHKNDVIVKEWYIYSDASIWDVSNGEFDLCFDLLDPYRQRIC